MTSILKMVKLARAAGIYAKGGRTGTCKGIFRKCMGAYHLNEDGQRLLQGIVPDGFLEAQQTHYPAVDIFFKTKLLHLF